MADEPSLGELGRLIQLMRGDIRDDMASINSRLDRMVSLERYTAEQANVAKDLSELTKAIEDLRSQRDRDVEEIRVQRERDSERVTQTRRWTVASVIIPLIGFVIPLILTLRGVGQ